MVADRTSNGGVYTGTTHIAASLLAGRPAKGCFSKMFKPPDIELVDANTGRCHVGCLICRCSASLLTNNVHSSLLIHGSCGPAETSYCRST